MDVGREEGSLCWEHPGIRILDEPNLELDGCVGILGFCSGGFTVATSRSWFEFMSREVPLRGRNLTFIYILGTAFLAACAIIQQTTIVFVLEVYC